MGSGLILVGLLAILVGHGHCQLKLASYFASHMVLQRGPQHAVIWGTATTEGDTVTALITGAGAPAAPVTTTVSNGAWKVKLPPVTATTPFVITVSSSEGRVVLNDVLFGDVWLCSGQSNMYFTMNQEMNSTEEIQHALQFHTIRYTRAKLVASATPRTDMVFDIAWTGPTASSLSGFSAVCWMFAEYIQPHLSHPIGLIESSWGGTPIEAWSSPEALTDCSGVAKRAQNDPANLWNAMINPLLGMTLYGALWYQGESNSGYASKYSCQIQAMIRHWRTQFYLQSQHETSNLFPFGYVQLAGNAQGNSVGSFPAERWAQTANYGYSPNPALPSTFMAVAMDLPDFSSPYGTIHPRYKQDVSERLMLGALNVAYGDSDVIFQGPFPTRFTTDNAQKTLTIEYDHGQTPLEVRSQDGYEVCCSLNNSTHCDQAHDLWAAAPIRNHATGRVTVSFENCGTRHLVGLRYEWRTSPCDYKRCTLYAADSDLPAPPYITTTLPA